MRLGDGKLLTVIRHTNRYRATRQKFADGKPADNDLAALIGYLRGVGLIRFVVAARALNRLLKRIELVFYWRVIAHGLICEHGLILPQKGAVHAST
jgi:hypothetical protein